MKNFIIIPILLLPIILFATTFYVDANGGQDFTTINGAINAAYWTGDRIVVYPGIYHETVDYQGKNLIISSLEMTTGDQSYIAQTIIDGENQRRCVFIENITEGVFEGFTIKNGFFNEEFNASAAGININNSNNFVIKNCHIFHHITSSGPAGLGIQDSHNFTLSGLSIHDNRSYGGTGLGLYFCSDVTFDADNRCSIYNNMGCSSVDIACTCLGTDINVILDTVTVANPSEFFIRNSPNLQPGYEHSMTLEYEHYVMDEIDHDLYVAPDGDNNNDGLTPETPLQAIQEAVYRIKPNPDNPHTIHLASGDYSLTLNNQIFPIGIKDNVKIIGEDNTNIYFDDPIYNSIIFIKFKNTGLENINFYPQTYQDRYIIISHSVNLKLKNLNIFSNGDNVTKCPFSILEETSGTLDNININGITALYRSSAQIEFSTGEMRNCNFSNNTAIMDPNEAGYGLVVGVRDSLENGPSLIMENCVFQNNKNYGPFSVFGDSYNYGGYNRDDVVLNNLAFINNNSYTQEINYIVSFSYGPDPVYMNNCLVVGNGTAEWAVAMGGNITVNNSIFYNHSLQNEEFVFWNTTNVPPGHHPYPTTVTFNNCAIKGGETSFYDQDPAHNTIVFNNTIDIADYELSDLFTYQDSTDFMSYQLAPGSPLIDAGFVLDNNYTPDVDLLGHNRIWGEQIDIGPFEFDSVGNDDNTEENVPPLKEMEIKNYPNPFKPGNGKGNTGTIIAFKIPKIGDVSIEIFNIKGQKVRDLKNVTMLKGEHKIRWNGLNNSYRKVSSGIYFCTIKVDKKLFGVHKMMVLK